MLGRMDPINVLHTCAGGIQRDGSGFNSVLGLGERDNWRFQNFWKCPLGNYFNVFYDMYRSGFPVMLEMWR